MNQKAIASLRAAVLVSPENVPLRYHLAAILAEQGCFAEAQSEYQEALKVDPHNAVTLLELGRVLHQLGKNEEAAARLSEAVCHESGAAEAHLEMSRVLLALKQLEKAQRHYNEAMSLDPTLHDTDLERSLFPPDPKNHRRLPDGPQYVEERDDTPEPLGNFGLSLERPSVTFTEVGGMEELNAEPQELLLDAWE